MFSSKEIMIITITPSNKSTLLVASTEIHLSCFKGQINLYEDLCHDVIHDYIEEQARQPMLSLFSNSKMDHIVGLFAIAYASSLTFINDPHITFQKLMCCDLIKCLKSVRMEQFPLLFSHRNLVIKISVRLVQAVSLEM